MGVGVGGGCNDKISFLSIGSIQLHGVETNLIDASEIRSAMDQSLSALNPI